MIKYLLYLFYHLINYGRYVYLYDMVVEDEPAKKSRRTAIVGIAYLAIMSVVFRFFYKESVIIIFFGMAISLRLLFRENGKQILYYYFPAYIILSFVDEVIAMVIGVIFKCNPLDISFVREGWFNIATTSISVVILMLVDALTKDKGEIRRFLKSMNAYEYVLICATLFFLNMLMSIVTFCIFYEDSSYVIKRYGENLVIYAIASVASVIILIWYLVFLVGKHKMQMDMIESYEKMNRMQAKYYMMMSQKNDEIRMFRHDFHHHMKYLNQLMTHNNYGEVAEYIDALTEVGHTELASVATFSGNSVIDAIIFGTVFDGTNTNIEFKYSGKIENKLGIRDIDLITLLSNALENAVEACSKSQEKPEICMYTECYKQNIKFVIENTFDDKTSSSRDWRYTTKRDKAQHGFGRINMKRIVEKYDGLMEEERAGNKFKITIQLNQKIEQDNPISGCSEQKKDAQNMFVEMDF